MNTQNGGSSSAAYSEWLQVMSHVINAGALSLGLDETEWAEPYVLLNRGPVARHLSSDDERRFERVFEVLVEVPCQFVSASRLPAGLAASTLDAVLAFAEEPSAESERLALASVADLVTHMREVAEPRKTRE